MAQALAQIIQSKKNSYGIYHFSNDGVTSWYGFAREIFDLNNVGIELNPIPTSTYPTPAKRPEYSLVDKNQNQTDFRDCNQGLEESLIQI